MNPTRVSNEHLIVEALLHEENDERLLLLRFEAINRSDVDPAVPLQLALVIDRSGSMSGQKLEIAKQSAIDMVDSLSEGDRVGIVIYDDEVEVLQGLAEPTEETIQTVRRVHCGGSTNLHGGWLQGVRLLPGGGHVVLLSDGLANVGRFTDAASLALEAERAVRELGVTTTTIGIGTDYDERLMAQMAEAGRGAHYFARTAASISDAFSHERFLMLSTAITDLEVAWTGGSLTVLRMVDGEVRHRVAVAPPASLRSLEIRYTDAKTGERHSLTLPLPEEATVEPQATAHLLAQQASELMGRSLDLNSQQAAQALHEEARALRERIAAHPLAGDELLRDSLRTLDQLIEETDRLSRWYTEEEAHFSRKRAYSRRLFLESSAQAYSSEEYYAVRASERLSRPEPEGGAKTLKEVARMLPKEEWIRMRVVPVAVWGHTLGVAACKVRDGLVFAKLRKKLGMAVEPDYEQRTEEEVLRMIDELFDES
ncbi:MAG: VWA domain-containing protein [Fimbriimonadaceae bacterium]